MSYQRTRTRYIGNTASIYLGTGTNIQYPICEFVNPQDAYSGVRKANLTETCTDFVNPGPPYREGHDFFLKRKTAVYNDSDHIDVQAGFYKYSGKYCFVGSDNELATIYANYEPSAGSYGAQAYKRFRPVQPRMGLGQAIGELRDFPSLFKLQLRRFKDLGSGYLNYQFGWRPFIKDLLDFIQMQKKVENHIRFVRKNNGKWLKRSGVLRDETSTTTADGIGTIQPVPIPQFIWGYPNSPIATRRRTLITKDRIWFEGRMKFYIWGLEVDKAESVWTSPLLRKLYGFEITPSLLWELTPFTWLADWISNVGDIYDNMSNQAYDNLVTKYAYVMRHRSSTYVYTSSQQLRNSPAICADGKYVGQGPVTMGPRITPSAVFTVECKERAQAFQWSIGNGDAPYSDRQLAILAALLVSKGG